MSSMKLKVDTIRAKMGCIIIALLQGLFAGFETIQERDVSRSSSSTSIRLFVICIKSFYEGAIGIRDFVMVLS